MNRRLTLLALAAAIFPACVSLDAWGPPAPAPEGDAWGGAALAPQGEEAGKTEDDGAGGLRTTDELREGKDPGTDATDGAGCADGCGDGCGDGGTPAAQGGEDPNRITDKPIPMLETNVPDRPKSLLEIGDPFMHPGVIGEGITLPTGQVIQPSLLVYGTFRTGITYVKREIRGIGGQRASRNQAGQDPHLIFSDWANRLDVFANFRLSPTERVLLGFRPLDDSGVFTGYELHNPPFLGSEGSTNGFNLQITTFFFEGDVGEMFPRLDPDDSDLWDIGFSFGRQPVLIQDGLVAAGTIDAFIVTRNSLRFSGTSNFRVSGLLAWDEIHRGDNIEDESATMVGILTETDFSFNTVEFEILATSTGARTGDALYLSVGSIQRVGHYATSVRLAYSHPFRGSNTDAFFGSEAVTKGALLFFECSWTPPHSQDHIYVNGFLGMSDFSSAVRDPAAGGPLGRVGILFAATGLGRGGSPLNNDADDAVGAAVGYQWIPHGGRQQLIVEVAFRSDTDGRENAAAAVGGRYQRAFGDRYVLVFDLYLGWNELVNEIVGSRLEALIKF